ncbi:unnamed protein product, partial [Musa acuminata subsp. malaccensis]
RSQKLSYAQLSYFSRNTRRIKLLAFACFFRQSSILNSIAFRLVWKLRFGAWFPWLPLLQQPKRPPQLLLLLCRQQPSLLHPPW